MNEILLTLLLWIQSNAVIEGFNGEYIPIFEFSEAELVETLPKVEYVDSPVTFLQSCLRSALKGIPGWKDEDLIEASKSPILGCYTYYNNTIYIRSDIPSLSIDTIYGQSILVHELTHWLQYKQMKDLEMSYYVHDSLEKLAYQIDDMYLKYRMYFERNPITSR